MSLSFQPAPQDSQELKLPRLQGELLEQRARFTCAFDYGLLPCNLCVDHSKRTIMLRFDIGTSAATLAERESRDERSDPGKVQVKVIPAAGLLLPDPDKHRMASQIAEYVRSDFDGLLARLQRFAVGGRQAVFCEGPFLPADRPTLELEIRVTRDANFDRLYDRVHHLIMTHPLNDRITCPLKPGRPAHEWSKQDLDRIEQMPKEPGTPEALHDELMGLTPPSDGADQGPEAPKPEDAPTLAGRALRRYFNRPEDGSEDMVNHGAFEDGYLLDQQ